MPELQLAAFRADVTPPLGSPLCGGLVKPVEGITDPLYALGIVLCGAGDPVVLCAVDWCEIRNDDYFWFQDKLADAVGTVRDRVAIQCVHQHNAPLFDAAAQAIIKEHTDLSPFADALWFQDTTLRVIEAATEAMQHLQPVTHVGFGQAEVHGVAANRRILGPDGKMRAGRMSSCNDPELRAEPVGVIDPMLKTINFWNGDQKLAALHYYATHPMSYYGDGLVTSDFAGIARERRSEEESPVLHLYFNGCGGNLGAGKFNDGTPECRPILSDRIYQAMVASERPLNRFAVGRLEWRAEPVVFPPRPDLDEDELLRIITDPAQSEANRKCTALALGFLRRSDEPILLPSLHLGQGVAILHLPGEPFVEYQQYAQELRPEGFVAVAGYGDGATGYIPLAKSYDEGGYEPTQAHVGPGTEELLHQVMARLLSVQNSPP